MHIELGLHERILINRRRAGKSQDVLAEELGLTRQAVARWELDQGAENAPNWLCEEIEKLDPSEKVVVMRRRLGMTAQDLANTAGVARQFISEVERGHRGARRVLQVLDSLEKERQIREEMVK